MEKVSLYFCQGTSDKEYHIQLVKEAKGYIVNFQYGRRGNTLNCGTKTETPVSLEEAQKIYTKLLKSKTAKGYREGVTQNNTSQTVITKVQTEILPQLLNPIENIEDYINNINFLAQEKFDGERRLIVIDEEVYGLNRKGQKVSLPESILKSLKGIKAIFDGEIIGDKYYVFDILSLDIVNLKNKTCLDRVLILESLSFGKNIVKVQTAFTPKEKRELLKKLTLENKEGIVFKKIGSTYQEGRPASGGDHLKYKFYKTATFLVKEISKNKRSVGLELYDKEDKVFMGKVTIPPNKDVPKVGDLVEVRYLYAYKGGCIFQPVYIGLRNDLEEKAAVLDQIVYKNKQEDDEN